MWNWLKSKVTRIVIEQKIIEARPIITGTADLVELYGQLFSIIALRFFGNAKDVILEFEKADDRSVRLVESWFPVFEAAMLAYTATKPDIETILVDVKKLTTIPVDPSDPEVAPSIKKMQEIFSSVAEQLKTFAS